MNKTVIAILVTITVIAGIVAAIFLINGESSSKEQVEPEQIEMAEEVTDECTEEYEYMEQETEQAASEEEKLSPNAVLTFEKYYTDCQHTINRYEEVPEELVNATKEELQTKYNTWQIKEFLPEKVVLYQEIEGSCGEHYMLRDVNGTINIYELGQNGEETLLEETDIATEYLTETDMIDIQNGLIVYGKENLNMLLEDFE